MSRVNQYYRAVRRLKKPAPARLTPLELHQQVRRFVIANAIKSTKGSGVFVTIHRSGAFVKSFSAKKVHSFLGIPFKQSQQLLQSVVTDKTVLKELDKNGITIHQSNGAYYITVLKVNSVLK